MSKVYLIKAGKYYKIGFTKRDLSERMRELQTGNPFLIEVINTKSFFI